jgi:hypothetical protein
MRRREFIALLSGDAGWPLAARAQQRGKVSVIGYVSPFAGRNVVDEAFEDSLQQLGEHTPYGGLLWLRWRPLICPSAIDSLDLPNTIERKRVYSKREGYRSGRRAPRGVLRGGHP